MQSIERNTMEQISGGSQDFFEWLIDTFTGNTYDEPDRWIYEEMKYNEQSAPAPGR
ncbi:hypothetical protein [Herbaspirillum sp. alder98]|uniref:hypothetical protein n=1 Tax=Herbaspirillum sp. alder98 TaxID=2913096 RepID=UPI001CD88845|nr:hypothetical protein [Herbaspirillum sp. alder98]MCA1323963.1 hypothetical protein [Herbaspirillum sp. alder98]